MITGFLIVSRNFYPRPPRGGRHPDKTKYSGGKKYFYPRPPRGGRREELKDHVSIMLFLSTPSARRATLFVLSAGQRPGISIHALREEGDV